MELELIEATKIYEYQFVLTCPCCAVPAALLSTSARPPRSALDDELLALDVCAPNIQSATLSPYRSRVHDVQPLSFSP